MYTDNWFEIMKYLDIHLPSLALTCKLIYQCYLENQHLLCNEGRYRLSSFQHQLIKDMQGKYPLVLQVNNNIGTKAAILSMAFKYDGSVVIMTSAKQNIKWKKEIKQLYGENKNILISHYCKPIENYKIIIVNRYYELKNNLIIVYKYDRLIPRLDKVIFFSGKVKNRTICHYIEYPPVKPIRTIYDWCCYQDNPKEILLSSHNDDYLYKPLNERLDDLISKIILYHKGPYLIIGDSIMTSHRLKKDLHTIRSNDIVFMSLGHLTPYKFKTVIILWPGHMTKAENKHIDDLLNKIDIYRLNVFNIHSTIEEKYLYPDKNLALKYDLTLSSRKKLDYLLLLRDLKYHLDDLSPVHFALLMYVVNSQLPIVYKMIQQYKL